MKHPLSAPPAHWRLMHAVRIASRELTRAAAHSHVILPKHIAKNAPKGRLLTETEWRGVGVQQSRGWVHYAIHRCQLPAAIAFHCCLSHAPPPEPRAFPSPNTRPEPHILLFRRPNGTDPTTGLVAGKRIDPNTGKVM